MYMYMCIKNTAFIKYAQYQHSIYNPMSFLLKIEMSDSKLYL